MKKARFTKVRDDKKETVFFDRKKEKTVAGLFKLEKGSLKNKYMAYQLKNGKIMPLTPFGVSTKKEALAKVKKILK